MGISVAKHSLREGECSSSDASTPRPDLACSETPIPPSPFAFRFRAHHMFASLQRPNRRARFSSQSGRENWEEYCHTFGPVSFDHMQLPVHFGAGSRDAFSSAWLKSSRRQLWFTLPCLPPTKAALVDQRNVLRCSESWGELCTSCSCEYVQKGLEGCVVE